MAKGMTPVFKDELAGDPEYKDTAVEAVPLLIPKHTRRLSDKLFVAFHQACDTANLDVAEQLLGILEKMMSRPHTASEGNRRRNMENVVAAYERLWHLRHSKS